MKNFLTQFAQKISADQGGIPNLGGQELFTNILNFVYFAGGLISVIVIIIAGFMFVTSSGDTGKLTKAKGMLTYSIVGLIVVMVAFTITGFITGRFS